VSVRGFNSKEMKGPNDEVIRREAGTYWGSLHVLEDGEVKYNIVANKSMRVADRKLLRETENLPA